MNNVNMTDIAHKIHFIYKDECERNAAAMVIFYSNGEYFFDEKHKNKMTNDEVEALLLRGALVYKDDEYVKPSSFNNSNVSFGNKNTIVLGNYIIQFNKDEDTLDFLYNGVIDEPIIVNNYVREGLSMYIDAIHGSISDITGKHTITNHGVTHTSDNNYLNFVASESDYLDTDFVPNLTQWSAELYFYFTNTPTSTQYIIYWGDLRNRIRIVYSGSKNGLAVQSNEELTRIISDNSNLLTPHHLIVTMNNGVLTSYLDGVKTILCSSGGTQTSHTGTLKIGTKYSTTEGFANINLRTFRFYDGKVLTDEEALQNYNYEINRGVIKPTWTDNMKLDTNTGLETTATKNACTEFIPYDSSYNYTLAIDTVTFFRVYYYDSSQSYISNDSIADNFNDVITPPQNTKYMRLKLNKGTAEFADLDNHVILRKTHK